MPEWSMRDGWWLAHWFWVGGWIRTVYIIVGDVDDHCLRYISAIEWMFRTWMKHICECICVCLGAGGMGDVRILSFIGCNIRIEDAETDGGAGQKSGAWIVDWNDGWASYTHNRTLSTEWIYVSCVVFAPDMLHSLLAVHAHTQYTQIAWIDCDSKNSNGAATTIDE